MKTQRHEPLLTEEEILNLLTPQAATSSTQEPQSPFITRPLTIIGGALLAAAGIATVYYLAIETPVVETVSTQPVASTQHVIEQTQQQQEQKMEPRRQTLTEREQPLVMTMDASRTELASLGVNADDQKIWFIEDGQRVTISHRGISLKPSTEADLNRTPVAVTLYDTDGAYASWYDHQQGAPEMNDLVPVKITLQSDESDLHQNVVAYLWFAPEQAMSVEKEVADYQETRDDSRGVSVDKVYPNPVSGNEATLILTTQRSTNARICIVDVSGRQVAVVFENVRLDNGSNSFVLPDLQSMPSGMVLVTIDLPEHGTRLVQRLLIQR
ncbi:MAG TPA: T9SS type A sorting domain-containing protein [Candidatus Didemnitutus sp.]|nr:T9SS type A sorting domain-containing protein [Candidatus Didemnitutus sp.]